MKLFTSLVAAAPVSTIKINFFPTNFQGESPITFLESSLTQLEPPRTEWTRDVTPPHFLLLSPRLSLIDGLGPQRS